MFHSWKRLLALFLAAAMVFGVLPTGAQAAGTANDGKDVYIYTEADTKLLEQDVFAKINAVKDEHATKLGGAAKMEEKDFAALVPEIEKAVEASDTY